jgi:predicted nucleotidyltransferase
MQLSTYEIKQIRNFFTERPVIKAYVFGSFSRDEADEGSDIDILIELDHTDSIGLKFFGYQEEVGLILQRKVDLVTYDSLSKYIKPYVDRDKTLIYERPRADVNVYT